MNFRDVLVDSVEKSSSLKIRQNRPVLARCKHFCGQDRQQAMPSCRGIYGSERAWSRFTEILRWQNPLLV